MRLIQSIYHIALSGRLLSKVNLHRTVSCVGTSNICHNVLQRNYGSTVNVTPIFMKQLIERDFLSGKPVIIDNVGTHSYFQILEQSFHLSVLLKKEYNIQKGDRVAFLCPNNSAYTIVQWAIWMLCGIGVPMCTSHPPLQLQELVDDAKPAVVIATNNFYDKLAPVCAAEKVKPLWLQYNHQERRFVPSAKKHLDSMKPLTSLLHHAYTYSWKRTNWTNLDAVLIYTSGTTSKPKGVGVTHGNMNAQIDNMVSAWQWTSDDVILHTLPLHHIHGMVNCLATPLSCGATCVMLPSFDAGKVWEKLLSDEEPRINVFMAVPTVYAKLIEYYNNNYTSTKVQDFIRGVCKENIRLMVSGSAALPTPVMEKWKEITGHTLLERYGMTEVGMALTNPLHGDRVPGAVGNPFPNVEIQIVDKDGTVIASGNGVRGTMVMDGCDDREGELYIKGPSVFTKYWRRPEVTKQSFTSDGWFKTGDTAIYQDGVYKILGRNIDIIKSGGYKISALEVERHLLANDKIKECAVFGLPDSMWGECIAVVAVLEKGESLTVVELKRWATDKLAHYKIPSVLECVDEIPKNPMGKVNKKIVRDTIFPNQMKQI